MPSLLGEIAQQMAARVGSPLVVKATSSINRSTRFTPATKSPKSLCFNFAIHRVNLQIQEASCSAGDRHRELRSLESLFCYDKAVPEQKIEKPVGLSIAEKEICDQPCCADCQAKGAVLCTTCGGSGLYVDSIMESQGIIVKVRCLGCGGTGNTMCSQCGGRGHL